MFLTDFTDLHRFVIARTARRYDEAGRSNQLSTLNSQLSILSTAYWPPVQYFAHIAAAGTVLLEQHENYQKQSYRNRCMIYAANGPTPLIIPVVKLPGGKMPVRDVRIDYATMPPLGNAYIGKPLCRPTVLRLSLRIMKMIFALFTKRKSVFCSILMKKSYDWRWN